MKYAILKTNNEIKSNTLIKQGDFSTLSEYDFYLIRRFDDLEQAKKELKNFKGSVSKIRNNIFDVTDYCVAEYFKEDDGWHHGDIYEYAAYAFNDSYTDDMKLSDLCNELNGIPAEQAEKIMSDKGYTFDKDIEEDDGENMKIIYQIYEDGIHDMGQITYEKIGRSNYWEN